MAQITWRNVDSPNFATSMDGIRLTSGLLGNATDSLSRGLAQFGEAQQDRANSAVMQRALQITDPNAYNAALQSGELLGGVDTSQVSARTLGALGSRANDLIANATNQQALDVNRYNFDRTQTRNAATDAATPIMAQIATAYSQGNKTLGDQLMRDNQALIGQLTPDQIRELATGNQLMTRSDIGNRQSAFDLGRSMITANRGDVAYDEQRAVSAALGDIMNNSLTQSDLIANAARYKDSLSGPAYAALINGVNRMAPGTFGVSGGGSGGTPSLAQASGMTYGGGQLPDNIQTVGQFVDNKSNLVNTLGASPVGLYQINADTWADFGPKVLGENWRDANVRDLAVQDQVAKAIWDSAKGSAQSIQNRWASITPAQAQAMQGKSWDEVKQVIASGESGANLAEMQNTVRSDGNNTSALGMATGARFAQDNANSPATRWLAATANNDTVGTVSADLAKNSPSLKGTGENWIANRIEEIRSHTGGRLNAAQAGAILEQSLTAGSESFLARGARSVGTAFGVTPAADNGMVFDSGVAERLANSADRGDLTSQALANTLTGQQQAQLAQAQATQAQAQATYAQAIQRVAAGQRIPQAQMNSYKAAYDRATQSLRLLQSSIQASPDTLPDQWRPKRQEARQAETEAQRIARYYGTSS